MSNLVAIIDHSLLTRKILEVCLRRAGWESVSFPNGEEALHVLAARPRLIPAVIVLEIDLPGIDGLQVIRLLRSDPTFDTARIVVLSGHNTHMKRLQAKRAGADRFLTKPFERMIFLSVVSEYINAERLSQRNAPAHDHPGGWNYGQAGKPLSSTDSPRLQSAEDLYAHASRC